MRDPSDPTTDRWGTNRIQHVVFSRAREGLIASALWAEMIYAFDEQGTRALGPFTGVGPRPRALMAKAMALHPWSLQEGFLAVAFSSGLVTLFNGEIFEVDCSLLQMPAFAVAFSPDGEFLIIATEKPQQYVEIYQVLVESGSVTLNHVHRVYYPFQARFTVFIAPKFALASTGFRFMTLHEEKCRIWDLSRSLEALKARDGTSADGAAAATSIIKASSPPS